MIETCCPQCNAVLDAPEELVGDVADCPRCGQNFRVGVESVDCRTMRVMRDAPPRPAPAALRPAPAPAARPLDVAPLLVELRDQTRVLRDLRNGVLFLCLIALGAILCSFALGVYHG